MSPLKPVKVREIQQGPANHMKWHLMLMVKRNSITGRTFDSIEFIREIDDGQPLPHVASFRRAALKNCRARLPAGRQPWIRIQPA